MWESNSRLYLSKYGNLTNTPFRGAKLASEHLLTLFLMFLTKNNSVLFTATCTQCQRFALVARTRAVSAAPKVHDPEARGLVAHGSITWIAERADHGDSSVRLLHYRNYANLKQKSWHKVHKNVDSTGHHPYLFNLSEIGYFSDGQETVPKVYSCGASYTKGHLERYSCFYHFVLFTFLVVRRIGEQ